MQVSFENNASMMLEQWAVSITGWHDDEHAADILDGQGPERVGRVTFHDGGIPEPAAVEALQQAGLVHPLQAGIGSQRNRCSDGRRQI